MHPSLHSPTLDSALTTSHRRNKLPSSPPWTRSSKISSHWTRRKVAHLEMRLMVSDQGIRRKAKNITRIRK